MPRCADGTRAVVEVQMIKNSAAGNPGLLGVRLYRDDG
jgi:hypothetical protein